MTQWYSPNHLLTHSQNPLSAGVKDGKVQIHRTWLLRRRKCLFRLLLLQCLWVACCFSGENVIEPVITNHKNSKTCVIVIFTGIQQRGCGFSPKDFSFSSLSSSLASSHSLSCFLRKCHLNSVTQRCPLSDHRVTLPWNHFSFHIWLDERMTPVSCSRSQGDRESLRARGSKKLTDCVLGGVLSKRKGGFSSPCKLSVSFHTCMS